MAASSVARRAPQTRGASAGKRFADTPPSGTAHVCSVRLKRVRWDKPIRVRRVHDTSVVPADHQGFPLLLLPHGLPESVYQVAEVIAIWMTGSHMLGTPYGFKLACGQHSFAERCATVGLRWSASTIYRALQLLVDLGVLAQIGELDPIKDPNTGRPNPRGALVYAPRALLAEPIPGLGRVRSTTNASLLVTQGLSRAEGALKWAIEHAEIGRRNHIGHWLACRCTDAGLDEPTTMKIVMAYRDQVPKAGGDPYTAREVRATVSSRFRRLTRCGGR